MAIDLRTALPYLLPGAIAWAEALAEEVTASGMPLDDSSMALARAVGVQQPERIHIYPKSFKKF